MQVAVTGASGLIGTVLCTALRTAGHDVIRVARGDASAADAIGWDPAAGTIDAAGLEGVDGVIHLAGAGIADRRWTDEQKRLILESRTKGTGLLATTLADLDRPPKVLVSGSAIGFYGDRGDEVLTETSEAGSGFLADVCVQWEAATRPAADAGIRVAHARTGLVLSTEGGALQKMLPLFRLGLGGRLGSGRQWWSWISIDDEVGALMWLLDSDRSGAVNLTAPNPVTNADFTSTLGSVLGRPTWLPVPGFGPKLVLGSELADELLFTSVRVEPQALLDGDYRFHHAGLEPALRAVLGRPTETT